MFPDWKIAELLALIRRRYPEWENFAHPPFVAEEVEGKRTAVHKARTLLSQTQLDDWLAHGSYDEFISHLNKLAKESNLLWQMVPASGDTAVLYHPHLDPPTFCTHMRNLLYGDRPSPERLQTFTNYLKEYDLPNKWPFATYYLFLCHPDSEMLVKPRAARWFMKFMWAEESGDPAMRTKILITMQPSEGSYGALLTQSQQCLQALAPFGAGDMVDVQSFISVCEQESREQTGGLDARGQIDLDVPPTALEMLVRYQIQTPTVTLHETDASDEMPVSPVVQPAQPRPKPSKPITLADCAAATGWPEETIQQWTRALNRKGQAVLYGPPGTGKTFMARQLAQHLASSGDGFWELVQFHAGYSYEAFVQGIRPLTDDNGRLHYELVHGTFRQFCAKAATRRGLCVLIIDEINRANLAAVLGDLMVLLEYRDMEIELAEGGSFRIPANVRIIGTMNSADRSIALVDHALRRRFAFIHLPPNEEVLRHYHTQTGFNPDALIKLLNRLNRQIGDPHYYLGVTFFMQPHLPEHLEDIWRMEIEPYLEEFFFDQPDQVDNFRWAKVRPQL